MAQIIEENLLDAIVKDDIKAFNAISENAQCGGYRLGRFPVLSLLYLYKSRKILSAYEEKFIKITTWEALREPASIAKDFSEKAGKCLRLYLNEVVSPLEMLLILDRTRKLKSVYPLTKASSAVKDRLQSIYSVKYSLNIKFESNDIILERRPLSSGEKKKLAVVCTSVFLAVAIAVATPVTVVALVPRRADGEVTKLKHIDFGKSKTYTLKNDIVIPDDFSVDKMNCTVVGNGNKLIVGSNVSLGELSGKISDLEIQCPGSPLFSTITEKAEISNVNVNVTADIQTYESTAFIAVNNYGLLDEVTVNISGKVSALAGDSDGTGTLTFGGMVLNNALKYDNFGNARYGIIRNSTVNYSGFTLNGESYANGMFGGIVGTNSGAVGNITVTGSITSDTFDLAGVCSTNKGLLSAIINEANLTQTSQSDGWNPIVCGIVVENTDTVEYCENRGALSAKSTCGQTANSLSVSAAGIVYYNTANVKHCKNDGAITAEGSCEICLGGIAVSNAYAVEYSENNGSLSARSTGGQGDEQHIVSVGGIVYYNSGDIGGCRNGGSISVEGSGTAIVGGIVSRTYSGVYYCLSSGDITVNADKVYVGGTVGSSEVARYAVWGTAEYCISESKIEVTGLDKHLCVGGITGFVQEIGFVYEGTDDLAGYYGGGVTNSFFIGSIQNNVTHFGNIVGVCGAHIYESNEYTLYNQAVYYNFKDNYYLNNSLPAFGATLETNDDKEEKFEVVVESKGATASSRQEIELNDAYKRILEVLGI